MKNKILKGSIILLLSGGALSIGTSLFANSPETIIRISGIVTTLILGSIGMWAIALVTPKDK